MDYLSLIGGLGAAAGAAFGAGQNQPVLNVQPALNAINANQAYQQGIIGQYAPEVQANLGAYGQMMTGAGQNYLGQVQNQGNAYLANVGSLYGPNSAAAQAQNVANKQQIYSTLPGTVQGIQQGMAASGGLSRGQAGAAAAGAYTGAARQYGQAAAGVNAQQTQAAQTATNNALTTVNNMDAQAFQSNFGMTQQEAQTILNSGNSALATQLSDLINSSNFGTSQTLGVLGAAATNGLNNAYMANANQQNVFNSATNLGLQGIQAGYNYYNPAPASYNGNYNSLQGQGLASTPPQGSDYYSPL